MGLPLVSTRETLRHVNKTPRSTELKDLVPNKLALGVQVRELCLSYSPSCFVP